MRSLHRYEQTAFPLTAITLAGADWPSDSLASAALDVARTVTSNLPKPISAAQESCVMRVTILAAC